MAIRPNARGFRALMFASAISLVGVSLMPLATVQAADSWTVTLRVHEATSLTDDDASGADDMYWDASLTPTLGSGGYAHCEKSEDHEDDNNHIFPDDWACTLAVTGGSNTTVQIVLTLMEHDTTSADDEFDINPSPGQLGLVMSFTPADLNLSIAGVPGWDAPRCVPGRAKLRGINGDDQAEVVFSVSASLVGAPDGDSDGDGLADTWEVCGVDGDGDGESDVDLAAMGADRFRKDIFTEIDWMVQGGPGGHSHAPWLPALVNAWHEFAIAPVTNPTVAGVPSAGGIALHVDTGTLYSNYTLDFQGDGIDEFTVPASGDVDVDGDGIIDIGNLGPLSGGPVGGNQLGEDPMLVANGPAPAPGAAVPSNQFFQAGSEFAPIKAANFQAARNAAFHYIVFGHQYQSTWAGSATDSSSGLSDDCGGQPTCNNMLVTLGGWTPRQTLDQTGLAGVPDGVPDLPPAPVTVLNGPGGLPVDGTILEHTGTFLHELGHNLGLPHGGVDGLNYKPNYLSIMNYSWQFRGIGFDTAPPNNTADPVGVDFDHDGFLDLSRFIYSGVPGLNPGPLNPLNEGVNPTPPPFLNETVGVDVNPGIINYSCPTPAPPAPLASPVAPMVRGNQPIDWDCNPATNLASMSADVNNVGLSSGAIEVLNGADDYATLRNGGLRFNQIIPGISFEEQRSLKSSQLRIIEPEGREEAFLQYCEQPRTLDFEDLAAPWPVSGEYLPTADFLRDADRSPEIIDGPMRNNVPTHSQTNSLVNFTSGPGVPMVVIFDPPLRAVSLYFGQAGLATSREELGRAVFRATDQQGLPMGEIRRALPSPSTGINELMNLMTVWPDEFIARLDISYEAGDPADPVPLDEPVQIDDLRVCESPREVNVPILTYNPPVFGDLPVTLRIESESVTFTPATDGGSGHLLGAATPFTGLAVDVDGAYTPTDAELIRLEGTTVVVTAPPDVDGKRFKYWEHSSGASFGWDNNVVSLTLLGDGVLTAVYEGPIDDIKG